MSQDSERVRLENIRKNNEFLASIGLFPPAPKPQAVKKEIDVEIREKKNKQKRAVEEVIPLEKRRRSSRLSEQFVKAEELAEAEDEETEEVDETPFYERVPQESNELDDFEFQAFVELRRWRLLRSRELGIESYKIFQNRTFCDMIRRRRNDLFWSTNVPTLPSVEVKVENDLISVKNESGVTPGMDLGVKEDHHSDPNTDVKVEKDAGSVRSSPRKVPVVKNEPLSPSSSTVKSVPGTTSTTAPRTTTKRNKVKSEPTNLIEAPVLASSSSPSTAEDTPHLIIYDPALIAALTDCFGIAAGKTKEGGFAWEALAALNRPKVSELLEQSRKLQPGLSEA